MSAQTHVYEQRLADLRAEMARQGVGGFIIPRADEYQGEYVPASAERLKFISGFTGSAGIAVVLPESAVVMSDGRYTIQLGQQVDSSLFETADVTQVSPADWIGENGGGDLIIGYDPRLHTPTQIKAYEDKGIDMVALVDNPLDAVWGMERPPEPKAKVSVFPLSTAGLSHTDKMTQVSDIVSHAGAYAGVLTLPDSIAWLLNIRGDDIVHIPVALSYAVVEASGKVTWFIEGVKITDAVRQHLGNSVSILSPKDIEEHLAEIAGRAKAAGQAMWLDGKRSSVWFRTLLEKSGAEILDQDDPCIALKAVKTPAEQAAMKTAHIRDGVAMVKFLCWLDRQAPKGELTELSVEEKLLAFRQEAPEFRDTSFDTIAGFNGNGAIVHYRATPETALPVKPPGLLLLDSGAQYVDGTTDITRTVAIGEPTEEMKAAFTLVLKGHMAVAMHVFPEGTLGKDIDALARQPLRDKGLDYAHGTGHGVGCYLSVHEESANLSPRGEKGLKTGMILSNEPGYYKAGEFGIRIESLVLVLPAGEGKLAFETITLCPIDRRLIVPEMLIPAERDWLNAYHHRVYEILGPLVGETEKEWLKATTQPV